MPVNPLTSNRQYASLLGWSPSDFGADGFDSKLVELIMTAQAKLGFTGKDADGVCGPKTYRAWLNDEANHIKTNQSASADPLADAGRLALYEAKQVWLTNIVDPPSASEEFKSSRVAIDAMIRTTKGLNWSWTEPYIKNGDY